MSSVRSRINLEIGKALSAASNYPQQVRSLRQFDRKERGILVTGAPRSGTTWVGHMLSCAGLWHIHEPFNPNQSRWENPFSYVSSDLVDQSVNQHVHNLLKGGFRKAVKQAGRYPIGSITRYAPFPVTRVLIKDPHASLLSDYITVNFAIDAIVLFRHPAAFVASVKKLGWGSCDSLKRMMKNPFLMEKLDCYRDEILLGSKSEGVESLAILHGALCRILWDFCTVNEAMTPVNYEELCADPISRFRTIFENLQLPYNTMIRQKHIEMCGGKTVVHTKSPHNVFRDSKLISMKWKRKLSQDDLKTIRKIWSKFQVPLYLSGKDWVQ